MKKRIKNSTLARPLALALLLPTLAAVCLASCRRADGSPAHSLVVGVDEFTEDPALTSPEVTSDSQGSGTIPQDETTRGPRPARDQAGHGGDDAARRCCQL